MAKKISDINEASELVAYLKERTRFGGIKYFTKYMKLSALERMFNERLLLLNSPERMNDQYELDYFSPRPDWNKICYSCFICQDNESMAMWSMYAQPWEEGVMISIPDDAMKELIDNTHCLVSAEYDQKGKKYKPGNIEITAESIISLIRVAYINDGTINCTETDKGNTNFENPAILPALAGYLKDAAWNYEKEARIRADLPDSYSCKVAYLRLPDSFLRKLTITMGPRCKQSAEKIIESLPEEYRSEIKIKKSKFNEKLAWTPCDDCKVKNEKL